MPGALITGGAGFIGSHVARALSGRGLDLVVLDDLSGGFFDNVPDGVEFVEGTLTDHAFLEDLFDARTFEYVFHLAAYAAEGLSHHIRRFNYDNNVSASASLVSLSIKHDVQRFIFTSSIAVYGEAQPPVTEETATIPIDPYGIAKLAVERDLAVASDYFGLEYTVFRPHNVYGEHQNIGDRYRNVIGIFMNQLMSGHPMTVFGDGYQTRAFSYIGDVAPVIAHCIDEPESIGETYNLGADQPYSVLRLAHMAAASLGVEANIEFLPERPEVTDMYASHAKVRSLFDLPEPTSLEVGLGRMAKWAQEVGPRRSKPFAAIEVDRNLPSGWEDF